jgi:hypothetical protein
MALTALLVSFVAGVFIAIVLGPAAKSPTAASPQPEAIALRDEAEPRQDEVRHESAPSSFFRACYLCRMPSRISSRPRTALLLNPDKHSDESEAGSSPTAVRARIID